jgi:RNA polymerase sigma-70 factor (ECF subfamily)
LREDTDVRAWLLTVARNEFVSHCRACALDLTRFLAWDLEQRQTLSTTSEDASLERLERALDRLEPRDRELLLLIALDGVDTKTARTALGVSASAFRQRLTRARKRLAEELDQLDALRLTRDAGELRRG